MPKASPKVPQVDPYLSRLERRFGKAIMYPSSVNVFADVTRKIYREKMRGLLTGKKPDFSDLPGEIASDVADLIECCMRLKVEQHGDIPKLGEEECGIAIANHPSDLLLWPWANAVAQNYTPKLKAVAKKELMYDPKTLPPIFGWTGKMSELLLFVDRSDRESAAKSLRKGCKKILRPQNAVCIFPDGHRPTRKGIDRSHAEMAEKDQAFKGLTESMPYTCFPKSGGLLAILRATEDYDMRILNTTVGSSVNENESEIHGSTIHIFGEGFDRNTLLGSSNDYEKQKAHLNEWLVKEWKRKNEMIKGWQEA